MKTCTVNDNTQDDQSLKQEHLRPHHGEDRRRPRRRRAAVGQALERRTRRRTYDATVAYNGQPYTGINILSLWASASVQGFAARAEVIPGRLRGPLRRREVGAIASDVGFAVSIESVWVDHDAADREIACKNSGSSFTSRNPASA